jgi:hypothetical protein
MYDYRSRFSTLLIPSRIIDVNKLRSIVAWPASLAHLAWASRRWPSGAELPRLLAACWRQLRLKGVRQDCHIALVQMLAADFQAASAGVAPAVVVRVAMTLGPLSGAFCPGSFGTGRDVPDGRTAPKLRSSDFPAQVRSTLPPGFAIFFELRTDFSARALFVCASAISPSLHLSIIGWTKGRRFFISG